MKPYVSENQVVSIAEEITQKRVYGSFLRFNSSFQQKYEFFGNNIECQLTWLEDPKPSLGAPIWSRPLWESVKQPLHSCCISFIYITVPMSSKTTVMK